MTTELAELSARYQRIYDELNAECFDGVLPAILIEAVRWQTFEGLAARYYGPPSQSWISVSRSSWIAVSDWFADKWHGQIERILLHEICHVQVAGHGKDFQAELRRVAALATSSWVPRWADDEVKECAKRERREQREWARARKAGRK